MSKLVNLLRRNPRMTMAGIVLVIVLVAVVLWMVTRDKKPESTGPQLEVTGEKIVKSTKVSEYAYRKMEYNATPGATPTPTPTPTEHRGWNIDFNITIDTKGGFKEAGITAIKIVRHKVTTTDSSGNEIDTAGDVLDTQYIDDITNYGTFTADFPGSALSTDAVGTTGGKNMFKVYGVKAKGDPDVLYTGAGTTGVVLASTVQTISQTDLNYTLDNASKVAFTFNLTSSSGSTLPNIESSIIRTKYRISIDPSKIYSLVPATDSSGDVVADKYKFKNEDGSFLTVDNTDVFKIDMSYGTGIYRAYTDDGEILTRVNGKGNLALKSPTEMSKEESETSLMTFSELGELDGPNLIAADIIISTNLPLTKTNATEKNLNFWDIHGGYTAPGGIQGETGKTRPLTTADFSSSSTFKKFVLMFETVDKVKNIYRLRRLVNDDYIGYAGNRIRAQDPFPMPNDTRYHIEFRKVPKSANNPDEILYDMFVTLNGVETQIFLDQWFLTHTDVIANSEKLKSVVVFDAVVDIKPVSDIGTFENKDLTYYSCANDNVVGCNDLVNNNGIGDMTGLLCKEGSIMYC